MFDLERIIIITGHYGSGKTNLALNLALKLKEAGQAVALADLDVVNPYFRTADFKDIAKEHGIELIASDYAGSNLDVPALSGGLDAKINVCSSSQLRSHVNKYEREFICSSSQLRSNAGSTLIIDVGGDDAGAFALGRYAPRIAETPYSMLYVVSAYRYLMKDPHESAELLLRIEAASRLKATHIANCSNLGVETTAVDIIKSQKYAEKISEITGRPLIFTAARSNLVSELTTIRDILPVSIYVKTPWNNVNEHER